MEATFRQFHTAIKHNDGKKIKELIDDGVMPDELDWNENGRPLILEATYHGHVEIVRLLLSAGANPNAQNTLGETALHNAFHPKTFSKEIVMLLLEYGADVNTRETLNGNTPLHSATKLTSLKLKQVNHTELLDVLALMCIKDVDVNKSNSRRETPLHRLVTGNSDDPEALLVLVGSGFNLNAQNDRGETSLMCAIDKGNIKMAMNLIESGACVNIKDRHFQTALHHCAQKNLLRLLQPLFAAQCDVNAQDLNGDTSLHIASSKGLVEMVRILLTHSMLDVQIQNILGQTALFNAVESGFTKVVQLLLVAYCDDSDCEKGLLSAMNLAEDNFLRRWHPEILIILREALEQKRELWDEGETSL